MSTGIRSGWGKGVAASEGLVYRSTRLVISPGATSENDLLLAGVQENLLPTRYRAVRDRKEPEVSIKPLPQSLTSRETAQGSGPAAASSGPHPLLMLTHPCKDIWKQKRPQLVRSPALGTVDRRSGEKTSSTPSWRARRPTPRRSYLPRGDQRTGPSEHPPPPALSCYSTGPFTLVVGDDCSRPAKLSAKARRNQIAKEIPGLLLPPMVLPAFSPSRSGCSAARCSKRQSESTSSSSSFLLHLAHRGCPATPARGPGEQGTKVQAAQVAAQLLRRSDARGARSSWRL